MSRVQDTHVDITNRTIKRRHVLRLWVLAVVLFSVTKLNMPVVGAQRPTQWPPQQRIPGYNDDAEPPYLIADQNRTVHAFASQQVGDEGKEIAITYNQWTVAGGWTPPIDILLSPMKHEARVPRAFLDQAGVVHLAFYGGDETEANIYYSRAPLVRAGQAPAWSKPVLVGEAASSPSLAALAGDDKGNLVILYSGKREGWGLYATYSADGGDTWTDPTPTFLTYGDLFPFSLKLSRGQSGLIHAIWDVRDLGGNGRQINYASLNLRDRQWSEPVALAEAETGYGVLFPTVIELDGTVFAAYVATPKVMMRRSSDGGRTWTDPAQPFRHVGANGIMSFAVDSKDDLHLLWAQRITGSPDIHGAWHSMWQGGDRWTEPEAIVSGPHVEDHTGDKAFDPFDVRAVVSQGNVLLATWHSDPGLKGNGVWYSYRQLDTPELPLVPIPTVLPVTSSQAPTASATATPASPTPTSTVRPEFKNIEVNEAEGSNPIDNPAGAVVIGLVPAIALLAIILIRFFLISHSRH
jgi:hypothetical protein